MAKVTIGKAVALMRIGANSINPADLFNPLPQGSFERTKDYNTLDFSKNDIVWEHDKEKISKKITSKVKKYYPVILVLAHPNPNVLLAACLDSAQMMTGAIPLLIRNEMSPETKSEIAAITAQAVSYNNPANAIKFIQDFALCEKFFLTISVRKPDLVSTTDMIEKFMGQSQPRRNFAEATAEIARKINETFKEPGDFRNRAKLKDVLNYVSPSPPRYEEAMRVERERALEQRLAARRRPPHFLPALPTQTQGGLPSYEQIFGALPGQAAEQVEEYRTYRDQEIPQTSTRIRPHIVNIGTESLLQYTGPRGRAPRS